MEEWKCVNGFKDYQINSKGDVLSFKRKNKKLLTSHIDRYGYPSVKLCDKGLEVTFRVHQLVAMNFLGHTIDGSRYLVVNHKNFIRTDNRVENLEIITNRENANRKHLKSTSKYVGVSWDNENKKWRSSIMINGKYKCLGRYIVEEEASNAYQEKLEEINAEERMKRNKL